MLPGARAIVATATTLALVTPVGAQSADPVERLRRDLTAIFTDQAVDHAQWSVQVSSLKAGDSLFSLNARRLQVPASNQKMLTCAVAAEKLGWDFTYTNRVYALGKINAGVLEGDLVVTSDGDPTINPRHPARWAALDDWAKQLSARGIHLISGQLIGDDNAFAEPGWGPGWSWDDIPLGYGAPVSALQYNENEVELVIIAGAQPGARATISTSPPGSGLVIDHGMTTGPAGSETKVTIERVPGSNILSVRGQIAADAAAVSEKVAVPNPTLMYVNAFREALARYGIFVGGNPIDIDDLRLAPDLANATLLVEDHSPPLSEIIDVTLKWSRNLYAETLLRTLARPETPATAETGLKVLRDTLRSWGVGNEYYLARDGSGLSRYDYLTPNALTIILTYLYLNPAYAELFRNTLPVAGVSGSLASRMGGTPASDRVWAKTGAMSQVRSISGYIMTLDHESLAFAIIVNGFRIPAREIDATMDKALLKLVEFKR
ncbi:MAG: D-alanyl-D-alanine carboxypeptidase/D-alanyl-D-alanine-endopeptidase [Vicinamibacterales bacterium]